MRLFAASGGYCQNPACLRTLFVDTPTRAAHIAEIAHIIAASDAGPRAKTDSTTAQRRSYENLILLCPTCHTLVDKMPEDYADGLLLGWKHDHMERISEAFGVVSYTSRGSAREALEQLLVENRLIFETHGPDNDYRWDPESPQAGIWKGKVLSRVLPNNQRILRILDANRGLLSTREKRVLEEFRQHVIDQESRHVAGRAGPTTTFPPAMEDVLK